MASPLQRARTRAPLKIVEAQEQAFESPEALPPPETAEPPRPDEGLTVPSTAGEFLEASVAEDGGSEKMGTRRGSLHQYRAVLHEAIVRVAGALDTQGVCDKNGRLRRSWLSEMEGLIREARAIDEMLGLGGTERGAPPRARPRREPIAAQGDADRLPEEIADFLDRMDDLE